MGSAPRGAVWRPWGTRGAPFTTVAAMSVGAPGPRRDRSAPIDRWKPKQAPNHRRRVIVVASVGLFLGVVGHRLAGGSVQPLTTILAAVPIVAFSWLAARRERGSLTFIGLMVASQLLVHLTAMACTTAPTHISGLHMVAYHAGAAVIAGLLLRFNEVTCWTRARVQVLWRYVKTLLDGVWEPAIQPMRLCDYSFAEPGLPRLQFIQRYLAGVSPPALS